MPKLNAASVHLSADTKNALRLLHPTVESFLTDGSAQWLQKFLERQQLQHEQPGDSEERALDELARYIGAELLPKPLSGVQLLDQLRDSLRLLPTGSTQLDELLRGGLKEGQLTELCGESGSGKTLLCHLAAVNTAQRAEHVLFIDTTNCFSASRCAQIFQHAQRQGNTQDLPPQMSYEAMLRHISVLRPHSAHNLLGALDRLCAALSQGEGEVPKPSLLLVDSVSAVLAPVLGGQLHYQGHALMTEVGRRLKVAAEAFSIAVLVTNHVVAGGAAGLQQAGGSQSGVKAAFGEHWQRQPRVRLRLAAVSLSQPSHPHSSTSRRRQAGVG